MENKQNISGNQDEKQKILVVDDEITILRLLKINLTKNGYLVKTASNGKEALNIIEQDPDYDLVLLDIMMPEMSGLQVCRALREKFTLYELPIMFVTAKFQVHDIIEGFDIGANDYILKPFDFKELEARAKTLVKLRRLTKANEKLNELRELTNHFHMMTIHDLKNPLTSILVRSEFVERQLTEDSLLKEQLSGIGKAAHVMLELINDYVEMSRIETGRASIEKKIIDISKATLQVIEANNYSAKKKSQEIRFSFDRDNKYMALADYVLITRVIDNLISNAIKFSPLGMPVDVKLETTEDIDGNGNIKFSVTNNGESLSREDQAIVFNKYQRLSTRPTGGETSSGLGLSIAKELIDMHNGRIWLESIPDKGSTFCFEIPLYEI